MTTPTPPVFNLDSPPNGPAEIAAVVAWVKSCLADLPAAVDSGGLSVSAGLGNTVAVPITFAPGMFTRSPAVVVSASTQSPGTVSVSANGTTAAGTTIYVYRDSASMITTNVNWVAVQDLS